MKELLGKNVLITCSNWFYAPDGKLYRAIWGTLKNICEAKDVLGFLPGRTHANWFIHVGTSVITGCQVNYLIECHEPPNISDVTHQLYDNATGLKVFMRANEIYHAV